MCSRSSAGGLLPLLLLLLATEGTSVGEEAARSEESAELLEHDDFMVRKDATDHISSYTGGSDGSTSPPICLNEAGCATHHIISYISMKTNSATNLVLVIAQ